MMIHVKLLMTFLCQRNYMGRAAAAGDIDKSSEGTLDGGARTPD